MHVPSTPKVNGLTEQISSSQLISIFGTTVAPRSSNALRRRPLLLLFDTATAATLRHPKEPFLRAGGNVRSGSGMSSHGFQNLMRVFSLAPLVPLKYRDGTVPAALEPLVPVPSNPSHTHPCRFPSSSPSSLRAIVRSPALPNCSHSDDFTLH